MCAVEARGATVWRPAGGVGGKGCKGVLRPWRRIYLPQFHGHGAAAEDSDGNKEGAALQDTAAIFGATVGQRRSGGGGMAPVKLLRCIKTSRSAALRPATLSSSSSEDNPPQTHTNNYCHLRLPAAAF
ncbi:hypothetical protein DFJ73DRAFT_781860 [Zopfochytrium polystomum]|nr:hypothetical protein DFJ73DRAFT_781860 [Zopfochytrium polystomum]